MKRLWSFPFAIRILEAQNWKICHQAPLKGSKGDLFPPQQNNPPKKHPLPHPLFIKKPKPSMEFAVKQWEWEGPKLCGKTCEPGDDAIRDRTLLSPVFVGLVTIRLHRSLQKGHVFTHHPQKVTNRIARYLHF